jgi:hypothetical protein
MRIIYLAVSSFLFCVVGLSQPARAARREPASMCTNPVEVVCHKKLDVTAFDHDAPDDDVTVTDEALQAEARVIAEAKIGKRPRLVSDAWTNF